MRNYHKLRKELKEEESKRIAMEKKKKLKRISPAMLRKIKEKTKIEDLKKIEGKKIIDEQKKTHELSGK